MFFNQSGDDYVLKYSKTTIALLLTASGEYKINKMMGIGIKLSYTYGSFDTNDERLSYSSPNYNMSDASYSLTAFLSFRAL